MKLRACLLAVVAILAMSPAMAHQQVNPELARQVKPRTRPEPRPLIRPPGDPIFEEGRRLFESATFGGNGRTCASCHPASNNFTIDVPFIRRLKKDDPLFVHERVPALAGLENANLLRSRGLILENLDGFANPGVLRSVPHTLGLSFSTGPADGVPLAGGTGWSGDGAPGTGGLVEFFLGGVVQHFPKTLARQPGVDFQLPTQDQLDAALVFMLSIGRQQEFLLDVNAPGAIAFNDAAVMEGQRLFFGGAIARDGSPRQCGGCHGNAGANGSDGDGLNTDTGVRLLSNAPACFDPSVPGDGGFGPEPLETIPLCGRQVPFRGNGQFNVPSVIEAADTAPFFHNNTAATLEEAVRFYTTDTFNNSVAGAGRAFVLSPAQVTQVAAFLRGANALSNIEDAKRSLAGARGRPTPDQRKTDPAIRDINDAIEVIGAPNKLFHRTGADKSLRDALRFIRQGNIATGIASLDDAKAQMVAN